MLLTFYVLRFRRYDHLEYLLTFCDEKFSRHIAASSVHLTAFRYGFKDAACQKILYINLFFIGGHSFILYDGYF